MPADNKWSTSSEISLSVNTDLHFVRRMGGNAQSLLVRDNANQFWIVKLKSHLQGPNALANELLGTRLLSALDLPTPKVKPIHISGRFFDDERTWFNTVIGCERPSDAIHFASRFVPDSSGREVVEFLPPTLRGLLINRDDCLGIFLFDLWAMHTDARQALYYESEGRLKMLFIDHGHIFGGPNWADRQYFIDGRMLQKFAAQDFFQHDAANRWITKMQRVLPSALETAIKDIPTNWYSGDIDALQRTFLKRLSNLFLVASDAVHTVRIRAEVMLAAEQRRADSPLRILSNRGTEHWL